MSTSANFSPRQRGDREQQRFGADNVANAPSTLVFVQVGGKVQSSTYTAGDAAILNLDTSGRLRVTGTVVVGAASEVQITDGTNKVGVTADSQLRVTGTVTLQAGTAIAGKMYITDGSTDVGVTGDSKLKITGTTKITSIDAGTNIIGKVYLSDGTDDVGVTTGGRLLITGTTEIEGKVAHDAVVSGNPVLSGAEAKAVDGTDPGAVAEGDATRLKASLEGLLLVNPAHPRLFRTTAFYSSAQTEVEVKATPGANLSLYVTDVILSVGATAGTIRLGDGNAGGAPVDLISPMLFAANGGAVMNFSQPLRLVANSSLSLTSDAVADHSVTISGFIAS